MHSRMSAMYKVVSYRAKSYYIYWQVSRFTFGAMEYPVTQCSTGRPRSVSPWKTQYWVGLGTISPFSFFFVMGNPAFPMSDRHIARSPVKVIFMRNYRVVDVPESRLLPSSLSMSESSMVYLLYCASVRHPFGSMRPMAMSASLISWSAWWNAARPDIQMG